MKATTPAGYPLIPYTLYACRTWLKAVEDKLNVVAGWTARSGRAGFATESRALGKTFVEIREEARWSVDSSLRIYIDVAAALDVSQRLYEAGVLPALRWARAYWTRYLTPSTVLPYGSARCTAAARRYVAGIIASAIPLCRPNTGALRPRRSVRRWWCCLRPLGMWHPRPEGLCWRCRRGLCVTLIRGR